MPLTPDAAYQVIAARDARFDGQLFVGVTSTGIYCRPICRVRTPQRRNCRFFESPAQAEAASFRPCLKCRPEIAPGPGLAWSVMDASRTLARQAAHALDEQAGGGSAPSLTGLALRLGVSDRHLRRIFAAEHGVTPIQYLQTRRLLLAKQLLTDTQLPVTQVALASGFRSLRRFNAAFADSYRINPSRLRGEATDTALTSRDGHPDAVTVTLGFRAPYDHARLVRFVAQRAIAGIEQVDATSIRRSVRGGVFGNEAGWIEATFQPQRQRVQLRYAPVFVPVSSRVVAAARRWLDLDAVPHTIDATLTGLPGTPGTRLPGSLDVFELAVRAVLGQQVSVAAARTLARRLVERFGPDIATPWPEITRNFPAPAVLANAEPGYIAGLGIVGARARAIVALAQAWPSLAETLATRGAPQALVDALCALPGIGPWTAHYIAMRACGWPDAFPPNDVAALKAMQNLFGLSSQKQAEQHAEAWRPWRAYAVLRLWNSLEPQP